ncbi:unnamed protein product [Brachionus calyciflorus]|uniref:Uncharacterized protein n=1 Tax=Brachionus calyciflorus TaxID=104777 RepID=A0A814FLX6_9BILA|nr:unnamed protein product [Brachionus calyciflorus]
MGENDYPSSGSQNQLNVNTTVNENIVTNPPQFYNPYYNSQFSTGNLNSILYVNQNSSNFTPNNYTFGTNFQFNNGANFQLNNNSNVNFN